MSIPFISEECSVFFFKEETKTENFTNLVEIYNFNNCSVPIYIKITLLESCTNPNLVVTNNDNIYNITITGSLNVNDVIIIDTENRICTLNGSYLFINRYPIIKENNYFSCQLQVGATTKSASYEVKYNYFNSIPYKIYSSTSVEIQNDDKIIELPKKYYNSENREIKIIKGKSSISIDSNMINESLDDLVDIDTTWHIVLSGYDEENYEKFEYILCEVELDEYSISGSEDSLVTESLKGVGFLLE